jgi:hypothetical protein
VRDEAVALGPRRLLLLFGSRRQPFVAPQGKAAAGVVALHPLARFPRLGQRALAVRDEAVHLGRALADALHRARERSIEVDAPLHQLRERPAVNVGAPADRHRARPDAALFALRAE